MKGATIDLQRIVVQKHREMTTRELAWKFTLNAFLLDKVLKEKEELHEKQNKS